jgi:hypothetical protein
MNKFNPGADVLDAYSASPNLEVTVGMIVMEPRSLLSPLVSSIICASLQYHIVTRDSALQSYTFAGCNKKHVVGLGSSAVASSSS